jgi:hypothetical protein
MEKPISRLTRRGRARREIPKVVLEYRAMGLTLRSTVNDEEDETTITTTVDAAMTPPEAIAESGTKGNE